MNQFEKNPLADFIRISLKGLVITEHEELKKIGVITGDDWDAFTHAVYEKVSRFSIKELLALISPLVIRDGLTPYRNFDTITTLLDMHMEEHPDMHPDEKVLELFDQLSHTIPEEDNYNYGSDLLMFKRLYLRQYQTNLP